MTLANLSICYTWKNIKSAYNNNKFKILLKIGMMNLIYLIDHNLFQTLKTILSTLLKNMKRYQINLLNKFTPIKQKTGLI